MVTAVICVVIDTTIGLVVGIIIFLVTFGEKLMESQSAVHRSKERCSFYQREKKTINRAQLEKLSFSGGAAIEGQENPLILYSFVGPITFLNFEEHAEKIETLVEYGGVLFLSFAYVHFMDSEAIVKLDKLVEVFLREELCSVYLKDVPAKLED